jgi:hypothetical protein
LALKQLQLQAPDISHTIVNLGPENEQLWNPFYLKPFDFEFLGHDSLGPNDPRLLSTPKDVLIVKKSQLRGVYPRKFSILYPKWNKSLLTSLLDLFQYFAKRGILWETFEFEELSCAPFSHDFTNYILSIANESNLFKHYRLIVPGDSDKALDDPNGEYLPTKRHSKRSS